MKKAVIITCFDWYDQRLEAVCEVLSQRGYKIQILTSDFNHIKKEKITEKKDIYTYIKVPSYKKNISLQRLTSHICFAKKIYKFLKKDSPDLIYALLPPNGVTKICARYKRKTSCCLFFDVIDMWPESMPINRFCNTLPYKEWRNLRDNYLNYADHIFLECELYRDSLKKVMPEKSSVLHLYKRQSSQGAQEILSQIEKYKKQQNKVILAYLGSINYIIDIETICKIVGALTKKTDVEVRIIGDGENRSAFINELERAGATVNYYGKVFEEDKKINILSECDYALNLMKDSVKVGLTIKSIDYLSYGLPLINNIKGDTWQLVEEEEIGVNYDGNVDKILDYMDVEDANLRLRVFDIYQKYFTRQVFQREFLDNLNRFE